MPDLTDEARAEISAAAAIVRRDFSKATMREVLAEFHDPKPPKEEVEEDDDSLKPPPVKDPKEEPPVPPKRGLWWSASEPKADKGE